MTGKQAVPPGLDVTVPNVARMYDYYLGGCFLYSQYRDGRAWSPDLWSPRQGLPAGAEVAR